VIPHVAEARLHSCLDQMEKDIEGAKKNLEEARAGVAKLKKELSKLNEQVATSEVRFFSFYTFL
jgi:peptidoglycan hydrolase CwlO-like protein